MIFISKFFTDCGQYFLNWLNLFDHALNTLLLGDMNETLSKRIARARIAGHTWAVVACKILTWGAYIFTLGQLNRDHCTYAIDSSPPVTAEIWSWSTDQIDPTPITIINDVEIDLANTSVS